MAQQANHAPDKTGVYIMRGDHARVLYVGKALKLRSRINQYLRLQDSRAMVPRLVREIRDIEYILTESEKEALLLERQLIKKLKPKYNVLLRDDKNFLQVRIDSKAPYPRFELVRRRLQDGGKYYGPFPSATVLREYVRLLSRAYRLRTCSDRKFKQRVRPCVMHQMGWCSAPCVFPAQNEDYRERLMQAAELLGKRQKEAVKLVEDMMAQAADNERYEDAARYRDLLFALQSIWSRQHVNVSMPLDADVFAVFHGPLGGAIYVLHVRESAVLGYDADFNEGFISPETCDLESLVFQYYEKRPPPGLVLAEFSTEGMAAAEQLLGEEHGTRVKLAHPQRGQKKALLEIARTNAGQVYEQKSKATESRYELLDTLTSVLNLPEPVEVVECIDISSFQGSDAVGAISVARDGALAKAEYRSFHIRGRAESDFEMMAEVVKRRVKQLADTTEPRLLLVDGGRAHLARILPLIPDTESNLFPAAIAKARPAQGLPHDRIYLPYNREAVPIPPDSRLMLFFQSLRDEAHRFGIEFHRKKRQKRVMNSPLLEIPGIGKHRRMELVRYFGSLKGIQEATIGQLTQVKGISTAMAKTIHEYFNNQEESS
jgi:excinuclease ABC subunit C